MKTLQTLAVALFLCLGQISFAQETLENPTAEEDIKVVDDYIDALMTNKMDVVASLVSDDHIGSGPSAGDTKQRQKVLLVGQLPIKCVQIKKTTL